MASYKKPFLCRIGLHKWGRAHHISASLSNVKDYKKKSRRCGEERRWTKTKKHDLEL